MLRILCEGCWPTLYWGQEAVAVDISKKLSSVVIHDPQNAQKINNWVLGRLNYFDFDPYLCPDSRNGSAPRDRQILHSGNNFAYSWRSPGHNLVTTIAATVKKYMNYDEYKVLSSDQQNQLEEEMALRLWTQLKSHAEVQISRGWTTYEVETANPILSIEVVWKQVDQDTIDKAFLSLVDSITAGRYINAPR